jgi:precorrin-6A/cobalt-precorrin-6A reductase
MDVLVTKDSGGADAKLVAARELAVPVIMIDRPAIPAVPATATVGDALRWLAAIDLLV